MPDINKSMHGIIWKKFVKKMKTPQTVKIIPDTLVFEFTIQAKTIDTIPAMMPNTFVSIAVPANSFVTGKKPAKTKVANATNVDHIDPINPKTNSGVLFILFFSSIR